MKLRIQHNSVRFRLSEEDMSLLKSESSLQERLDIGPGQQLAYGVYIRESNRMYLQYREGEIRAIIPTETARLWMESQRTGLRTMVENGESSVLFILEKDLAPRKKRA